MCLLSFKINSNKSHWTTCVLDTVIDLHNNMLTEFGDLYNDFTTQVSMWGAKKLKYLKDDDLIINQPISKDDYYEFYVCVNMQKKEIELKH